VRAPDDGGTIRFRFGLGLRRRLRSRRNGDRDGLRRGRRRGFGLGLGLRCDLLQAAAVGQPADAVGRGLVDARRVALDADLELVRELHHQVIVDA
jgi:hypothetical protein